MLQKTSVLQKPFDLRQQIFRDSADCRPTVVCFFIRRRKGIYLVRPQKGENISMLPQGEINDGETLIEAAMREGGEELGLVRDNFANMISLGTCIHAVPERGKVKAHDNQLHFVAAPVLDFYRPRLNRENKSWSLVWSLGELFASAQPQDPNRPMKFLGTIEASRKLPNEGLLDWDSGYDFDTVMSSQSYA